MRGSARWPVIQSALPLTGHAPPRSITNVPPDPNIYLAPVRRPASSTHCVRVLLLAFPGFPMMAFVGLIEPLRVANGMLGREAYRWSVVGPSSAPIESSGGIVLRPDGALPDAAAADRVVVCSGGNAEQLELAGPAAWLRRQARSGASLGAVADGAFVLARSGLLDGHACTVHWTARRAFAERFPDIDLRTASWVIDRGRFTSPGGVGALDLSIELVARDHGAQLAERIAAWFSHRRLPPMGSAPRAGGLGAPVRAAVEAMEARIEEPLRVDALCAAAGLSRDRLERAFRRETGRAPARYLRELRMARAVDLLAHSDLPIREVALACGYADQAGFTRAFLRETGRTPGSLRAPAANGQ